MSRVKDSSVPPPGARCTGSDDAWHYVQQAISDHRYFICICCLMIGPEEEFEQLGAKRARQYAGENRTILLRRRGS